MIYMTQTQIPTTATTFPVSASDARIHAREEEAAQYTSDEEFTAMLARARSAS